MSQAVKLINERWGRIKTTTLVTPSSLNSSFMPDIAFLNSVTPRVFTWNMFNHDEITPRIAIDLDGIICVDSTQEQNDNEKNYKEFIRHAKLKIKPVKQVKAIITGRLEKYRSETEDWVFENSISYYKLFINNAVASSRKCTEKFERGNLVVDQISEFKLRILSTLNPPLFVESNLDQALTIH